jgi:hypothetical protein
MVPLTDPLPPGMPTCRCPTGFTGPKCTAQVCAGYCSNNSTCTVNQGNQPQCRCLPGFLGDRCQYREYSPQPQGRKRGARKNPKEQVERMEDVRR